jgi:predicted transposase/invertase (TIGR01784 family)
MTEKPGNIHDAMFRAWFSAPEAAGLLFAEQMPERLFALFKPEPPELVPGSFIDDRLAEHRTDLLYRAPLKKGGDAYVYVVVEHKSVSDPLTPLQLLRYKCNIWARLTENRTKAPLTPVVPLVFYHGARPWSAARTFHGMFKALDDELRPLTCEFAYVLVDLGRIDDDKLSRDLRQRAHLAALKYNARSDMRKVGLGRVARLFEGLPDLDVQRILLYILTQHKDIGRDDLNRALLEYAPERKDAIMNKFLQEVGEDYFKQGMAEVGEDYFKQGMAAGEAKGMAAGEAKGMAAGEAKGRAETLLKLFSQRFGELSKDVERRVREADAETLDRWTLRVLDAKSLKDIIGH